MIPWKFLARIEVLIYSCGLNFMSVPKVGTDKKTRGANQKELLNTLTILPRNKGFGDNLSISPMIKRRKENDFLTHHFWIECREG